MLKLLGKFISYRDLLFNLQRLWQLKGSFKLADVEGKYFLATFDLKEDYMMVLTEGPWMVFGAYLTVQAWTLDFDPLTAKVTKIMGWVRVPGLSFRYYHKGALRAIGKLLGEVMKIDYTTEAKGRGRYARLAVLIDLRQPLVPFIKVDGRAYGVEYEGLPMICFGCGKYGHTKDQCSCLSEANSMVLSMPEKKEPLSKPAEIVLALSNNSGSGQSQTVAPTNLYGSWMKAAPKFSFRKKFQDGKEADLGLKLN